MEPLQRKAIYIALGMGITFFAMFLLLTIPHFINDVGRQWEEAFRDKGVLLQNYDEEKAKFTSHPTYIAFYEKYPEGGEHFRLRNSGGEMQLTAMNFDTMTKLEVELNLHRDNQEMYLHAKCENDVQNFHTRVSGTIVTKFIEEGNCLEEGHIAPVSPLIDENGNPVDPRVPEPTHPEPKVCGDGAVLHDGVCVIQK